MDTLSWTISLLSPFCFALQLGTGTGTRQLAEVGIEFTRLAYLRSPILKLFGNMNSSVADIFGGRVWFKLKRLRRMKMSLLIISVLFKRMKGIFLLMSAL